MRLFDIDMLERRAFDVIGYFFGLKRHFSTRAAIRSSAFFNDAIYKYDRQSDIIEESGQEPRKLHQFYNLIRCNFSHVHIIINSFFRLRKSICNYNFSIFAIFSLFLLCRFVSFSFLRFSNCIFAIELFSAWKYVINYIR